jgi:hypothetical protein
MILIGMILNYRYYYYYYYYYFYHLTLTDESYNTSEKLKCSFFFISAPNAAALSHGKPASAGTSRAGCGALDIDNRSSLYVYALQQPA